MTDGVSDPNRIPIWCWTAPLGAGALAAAALGGIIPSTNGIVIILAVLFLTAAVFAAVHHAEVLAIRIGEPFGSILLALAITSLEVGLIISVMATGSPGASAVARDTVYSVVMIVLNGIMGICLIVGAARHFEQAFLLQSATAILSVIATLAFVALVLPNFTLTTPGPRYSMQQLLFVGAVSLALYLVFVFVQTVRHRQDFVMQDVLALDHGMPSATVTTLSALLLVFSLAVVILLSKTLSPTVESAVTGAGLPPSVVGVVIASMILLPEGVTALKAASNNRLQASLNASLGSALASIGLTIPIVGAASVLLGQPLILGLAPVDMMMLLLTLFVASLTLATGRTTVLQGAVHLMIFGVFLFLSAVP